MPMGKFPEWEFLGFPRDRSKGRSACIISRLANISDIFVNCMLSYCPILPMFLYVYCIHVYIPISTMHVTLPACT